MRLKGSPMPKQFKKLTSNPNPSKPSLTLVIGLAAIFRLIYYDCLLK